MFIEKISISAARSAPHLAGRASRCRLIFLGRMTSTGTTRPRRESYAERSPAQAAARIKGRIITDDFNQYLGAVLVITCHHVYKLAARCSSAPHFTPGSSYALPASISPQQGRSASSRCSARTGLGTARTFATADYYSLEMRRSMIRRRTAAQSHDAECEGIHRRAIYTEPAGIAHSASLSCKQTPKLDTHRTPRVYRRHHLRFDCRMLGPGARRTRHRPFSRLRWRASQLSARA